MKSEHFFQKNVICCFLCLIQIQADQGKHVLRVPQNSSVGFFEYLKQTGLHCGKNRTSTTPSLLYRHDRIDPNEVTSCITQIELVFGQYKFNYKYVMTNTHVGMPENIDKIFTVPPSSIEVLNGDWQEYAKRKDNLNYLQNVGKFELLTLSEGNDSIYSGIYADTTAPDWPVFVYSENINGSTYYATDDQATLKGMTRAEYVDLIIYVNGDDCFWNNVSNAGECPRPPKITVDKTEYDIMYNKTMMLSCKVESIPPAYNIYWTQNAEEIDIIESPGYIMSSLDNSSLVILSADHTHLGIYQCCATNSYREVHVCGKSIMIIGAPYVNVNQTLCKYEPGKSLRLTCEFVSYPKAFEFYWFQIKVDTSESIHTFPTTSNTSGEYNFDILNMTSDDRGTYQCCVENSVGMTCEGSITVGEKLTVIVPQEKINATRNESITLKCTVEGFPGANFIAWYTPESILSPSSPQYVPLDNADLTIHHPMLDDSGEYICMANNDFGESNTTVVLLTVNGVLVTSPSETYEAIFSHNVTLQCVIKYHPELTGVEWRRFLNSSGQETISTDGKKYSGSSVDHPGLVINNLNFEDEGWYICTGSNEYQKSESNTMLLNVVGGTPTQVKINATSVMVNTSEDITLLCQYEAVPKVINITWYKEANGVVTKINREYPVNVLKFTRIQLSEGGNYTCCAKNAVGSTNSSAVSILVNNVEPMCPCECEYKKRLEYWAKNPPPNHTMAEWRKILKTVTEEIKRNLTIDKTTTSASIRKRTSAPDDRKSSKSVGIVGILLISLSCGTFILFDCFALRNYMTQIRGMGRRR